MVHSEKILDTGCWILENGNWIPGRKPKTEVSFEFLVLSVELGDED